MAASTFDALEATRTLERDSIERKHAEAIAEQLRTAASATVEQLATRGDMNRVETDLTAELRIAKRAMVFQGAVSLATLAAVLGLAWKLLW